MISGVQRRRKDPIMHAVLDGVAERRQKVIRIAGGFLIGMSNCVCEHLHYNTLYCLTEK